MKNIKSFFKWLDDNILFILTGFLIVIIPLYPKIPIADLIEGYIVRLRFDDIAVFITFIAWLIQLARKKITFPKNKISKAILIYLAIGFLSSLSAIFITKTVPLIQSHILKLFFHLVRRIEYFSLFFITYSAIKTKKDLKKLIKIALITLMGVILYGLGQKYLYWPAFSTMNREFSKGIKLYLQPNTRLFSTFAGHYDLAAYLMMALSFTIPAIWLTKNKGRKTILIITSLLGYWSLVLTTSRTSFIGYLFAITLIAMLLKKYHSLLWSFKRWIAVMMVSIVIMFFFSDLLDRFLQVIPNRETRDKIIAVQKAFNQPFVPKPSDEGTISELPSLLGFLFNNERSTPLDEDLGQLSIVASRSDLPPSTSKPGGLPSDVTAEQEEARKKISEEIGVVYTAPNYSENALKYGLSLGIRLDALWPQAIEGFKKNPLLGSGYSTLVKSDLTHFTYAESTDNDYLRMLGETGLLGIISFLAVPIFVMIYSYRLFLKSRTVHSRIIALGTLASISGIMITALYIDIFESSKVAYTIWILAAFMIRAIEIDTKKIEV